MARVFPVLPPTYYLDHFNEMTRFILSVYGEVIGPIERAFISDFHELGEAARCLYVRMNNRKRAVFTAEDLDYAEIDGVRDGLAELRLRGFAREVGEGDYRVCLDGHAKADLIELAKRHDLNARSGWAKADVVAFLLAELPFDRFASEFEPGERVIPARRETLDFLLYLHFGRLPDSLQDFTLRDLGVLNVKAREGHAARFSDLGEARAGFFYTQALRQLRAGDVAELIAGVDAFPAAKTEAVAGLRDRLLFGLGQILEKQKETARAVAIYERSAGFDSHERVVRLLYAAGNHAAARAMCEAMLASPAHDEEYIFAADFLARKFGETRTGVFTDLLRGARSIAVDELYRGQPELAAIRHFEADGWTAWHTENGLWPMLFGLLFWDELFETAGSFASDFDRLPRSLKDRTFHTRFAGSIAEKLSAVRLGEGVRIIGQTILRHGDEDNGLFLWLPEISDITESFLTAAPPEAVAAILERVAYDFYALRDGFPDLLLIRDGEVRFVEIKAEGDQIRRNQLARLNLLKSVGFEAEICRVAYRIDPDQTYVVVDVETTGGRAGNDRVTEIGAIKISGGKVIGEWHSLINPQRHIPAFITELTGIDDAMVADAPIFAEIADDFAAFLGDAIFVAHNVNFDYGMISGEYRRLERRFRYPKLCTVASMRRHYPGLPSYSLKNLCREMGVRLDNHHRALDDARAAAELLKLVNLRRLGLELTEP
jgi:DNA polymerase-3 subunit epsilon